MKRVLHISKYYYPFCGGTEQVAQNCVRALAGDCEQKVICFNHEPGTRRDTVDGVEVVRCGCFAKIASQSLSFPYGRELKTLLRDFRPDIVIFHYPNPFAAALLRRVLPESTALAVYWHLDIVRQKVLGKFFSGQNRWLVRRANALIATSTPYAEGSPWLCSAMEKCRVVPNSISSERLQRSAASAKKCAELKQQYEGKILCLCVGRHTAYKGIGCLISAAKTLDDRFRVVLIGSGELTGELKKQAGDDPRITFLGEVAGEELNAWYEAADLFCFPSVTRNEAFGIALAEAMYFGKPAVTFTIPGSGVNYVCPGDECGLEVPNGDCEAFAAAMRRLADDPGLRERLGKCGKERVGRLFLEEQYRENIRGVIAELG